MQLRVEAPPGRVAEPGADLTARHQIPGRVVTGDQQRAHTAAATGPAGAPVARDEQLSAGPVRGLAPMRAALPRRVRRVESFGDDALQAVRGARLQRISG